MLSKTMAFVPSPTQIPILIGLVSGMVAALQVPLPVWQAPSFVDRARSIFTLMPPECDGCEQQTTRILPP